jgi:trans-aconitate methyltransferase
MSDGGFQQGGVDGDLFSGTAEYYARFRRCYPPEVVAHIVSACSLDGCGRLLDAGCGTGQVFCSLGQHFEEVVAFDVDEEMVVRATHAAEQKKLSHVTVRRQRAEEISPALGTFRMVAFGASFHWMDRDRVAQLVYQQLEPQGWMVLILPSGLHSGTTEWEAALRDVIHKWLGPERRAGGGVYVQGELHEQVLKRSQFGAANCVDIYVTETWTIDEVIGWLYSTSYASKFVLQERAEAFEHDVRTVLKPFAARGAVFKDVEYTVISASRRAR